MNGVEELVTAVREGRTPQLPALVAALGPAERRACLPALRELRKQVRGEWSKEASAQSGALLVAGAGCHAGPAGAATWIGGRDFAGRSWARHPALAQVVAAQPAEWQVEVVTRLAARRGSGWSWDLYPLIEQVVRRTGCPVPDTEAFTAEWLRRLADGDGTRGRVRTLLERMREDAFTPVLVPRVFELADIGWQLEFRFTDRPGDCWPEAVAMLAADGGLDRADLIERCLARLVRGGKPGDQRAFLAVLAALAPTPEEYAARARSLVALLDGLSAAAGHAQRTLAELDAAGLVGPEVLVEASSVVLFRTEKKLVRAQLGWLDRTAKRSPEQAGPVVLAAAEAFGHPDSAVQERALNVVARHLAAAGEAVLPELRSAAEGLNPAHHARAGKLLGAPVGGDEPDTGWSDLLPPAPLPVPLGGPIATAAEVAEELSALMAAAQPDVAVFERTLDGLVRHAHRDRAALAEALEPVLRVHRWSGVGRWHDCGPGDVLYVAAAVAGHVHPHERGFVLRKKDRHPLRGEHNTPYGNVLAARLGEAAERVTADRPPLLLATPTDATGALAAAALVERLTVYEAAGSTPGQADLHAALLRLAPTTDEAVLAAAGRLASPAGRWVARWLRDGGVPGLPSVRAVFAPGRGGGGRPFWDRWWEELTRVAVAQPGLGAGPEGPAGQRLGAEFRALLDATEPSVARARKQNEWLWRPTEHWAAMLPHHREEQAARWLDWFADCADRERRGAAALLPVLAEAGGRAGLALHLAVAYGLGARFPEDRTAAVDALLVLAARGDLDGALLGRELGELVACGTVKPNRLLAALTTAAGTGAYATVWSVLAPALPALLAGESVRGTADLVAVAADAARRCSARGPIPEVSAVAARAGSGRLVKEARSLRDVLAG
ncbi:hypothetical protein J5Y04_00835 [Kitasatospora sp. RG8]|uniref:DUF7824 domain-containing protein n=1 Tax=Kitasatospora sp. RG8 TaxID=2820815 RepID=UPI001ADFBCCA|nr:DUF6493 family protein [Kitasatospora sp. RG8]MBP0448095.1 hypothetical protein [Kitasatospora sp. RG8]